MSYTFRTDSRYRMPTHFGPSLGPRQGVDGRRYACVDTPKQTIVRAGFEARKSDLSRLLPPGFHLREPHRIDFCFSYISEIEWLAGRGYNTFGVSLPAKFSGQVNRVAGEFLLVLWENMSDPITTGREELGFSKVFSEIPPLLESGDKITCEASWDGCRFVSLNLVGLREVQPDQLAKPDPSDGLLHYKYIPKSGVTGGADAQYATLTPEAGSHLRVNRASLADDATCDFRRSTWEELPTLYNIVNSLAALTLGNCVSASVIYTQGAKDLGDQEILR